MFMAETVKRIAQTCLYTSAPLNSCLYMCTHSAMSHISRTWPTILQMLHVLRNSKHTSISAWR